MGAATRLASHVYLASSSWLLNPMISRMHDAPMLKPSMNRAVCEADQRFSSRRKVGSGVDAKRFTKRDDAPVAPATALQKSQQILQQQDYVNYQILPPPLVRRNSKEWVSQYKKERIDKINYNNVFGGSIDANNEIPTLPPPAEEANRRSYSPPSPILSTAISIDSVEPVPSLSSHEIKNKASSAQDFSLHPSDVICGRGGKANTHPGNISFREEAKKLRDWYESSSKSEKFTISS